jgi:hypothetical protein
MTALRLLLVELRGMFAADLGLTVAVLALLALVALALRSGLPPLAAGAVLVAGVLGVLLGAVWRGAGRSRRPLDPPPR